MLRLSTLLGITAEELTGSHWDTAPLLSPGGGNRVLERFDADALKAVLSQSGIPSHMVVVKGFLGPVDVTNQEGELDTALATRRVYE